MTTREELANAIERVHQAAQKHGGADCNIVQSTNIDRLDRELLIREKWLHPIIQGWYMLVSPEADADDSSIWYANLWDFVRIYLQSLYGENYCLSAENSIDLHVSSPTIPKQIVVIIPKSGGSPKKLPFQTSVLAYGDKIPKERETIKGIQVMTLPYALCQVAPIFFEKNPQYPELALRKIRSIDHLVPMLVNYKFKHATNRLIGAYQFLGEEEFANELRNEMKDFGISVKGENPFVHQVPLTKSGIHDKHVDRIYALWDSYRQVVIDAFPNPPGIPEDQESFLDQIEDLYKQDAYNSLSIEGFRVDLELIDRVRNNYWNPVGDTQDKETTNALAARGYYEAFQEVKKSILKFFQGENPGTVIKSDLQKWYRALFDPSVRAGIIRKIDLYGYRKWPVYIRNSRHTPFPYEVLFEVMTALFICLEKEPHPAVRAVLGHYIFVFIHPYVDGNGRIGRFLMNTMLISGGYSWTIVHVKRRNDYISAIETAHVTRDFAPFTQFISEEMASN